MEISVVVPACNAGKYISTSIKSVIVQTFPDWELIVVDDGSKDNTPGIVRIFTADKRIKYIRQENLGVSAARNAGINIAMGKYITFLDADDFYCPDNLLRKYSLLKSNPAIDYVYCDVMLCDESLNDKKVKKAESANNPFKKTLLMQGDTIPALPSNIMVKTALMKEKFLFDEGLSNCADKYMKILLAKNAKGAYIAEALVKYRNSPGSMSKDISLLEHDDLYIAEKVVKDNIIPPGILRRRFIAGMFIILSGSWYRNAKQPGRAVKFAWKAVSVYPPSVLKLLIKMPFLLFKKNTL